MKKMKGFRALVAVLLAVMMVFSAATVFADPTVYVENYYFTGSLGDTNPDPEIFEHIDGNNNAAYIQIDKVDDNEKVNITLNEISNVDHGVKIEDNSGDIHIDVNSVSANGYMSDGLHVDDCAGTTTFDVGDLIARGDGVEISDNAGTFNINQKITQDDSKQQKETTISGVYNNGINIQNNTGTIITNQNNATPGNVEGIGYDGETGNDGILINGNAAGKTIDLNHNNVTGGKNGLDIQSNEGTTNIDANTVTGNSGDGIKIGDWTTNDIANKAGGTINLNVGDVEGNGNTNAIESGISVSGNAGTVNINQKTKTDQNNQTAGTSIYGSDFGIFILDNTGTINMKQEKGDTPGDITGGSTGIHIHNNSNDGSISLTAGKITGREGIIITNNTLGKSSTVVNAESVTATYSGIDAISEDKASITVKGKVSVVSDGCGSNGVITNNSGVTVKAGEVSVSANADDAESYGLKVGGGTVIVEENKGNKGATGNVTATDTRDGLAYGLDLYGDKKSDVVVEGTLYGDTAAINLADNFKGNAGVTVWKLETDGENLVTGNGADAFASAINYIVKATDTLKSLATITAGNTEVTIGEGEQAEKLSWQTAQENDDVTITLNLGEDEVLDSLYYFYDEKDKAGTGLLTIGNGITAVANSINTFVVKMKAAGGMLLGGLQTHTHEFTEYQSTVTAATCTASGTAIYKCKHCNATKQVTVAAKGHTEVPDAAVAATCTTAGKTAGSHCSACNAVIKAQETVPAKGHSASAAVKENEKAAKVGVAGSYDEVIYCKDCGAQISRKTVTVPALPEEKKEEKKQEEKQDDKQETAGTVKAAPVKAAMKDAPETPESRLVRELFENNADNVRSILPADILAQIPENVKRLIDTKTLKLVDYDESMGAMTFELVCGADFREDEEVWVVFVLPGEDTDRMFVVKGIGQADGTLLVTPSAEILKQLAGKTFVAAVLGK